MAALTTESRMSLERELSTVFSDALESSSQLIGRVGIWRDQYLGILPAKKENWSANVNIPSTEYMVDTA